MGKSSDPAIEAERRRKIAESKRKYWADPSHRADQSEKMREVYSDPALHEKISESLKKYWLDHPRAKLRREFLRGEFRSRVSSPEVQAKRLENLEKARQKKASLRQENARKRRKARYEERKRLQADRVANRTNHYPEKLG